MITMVGDYLHDVVERVPFAHHDGKSGALLERVTITDGRRRIVKRISPDTDLMMAILGDVDAREHELAMRRSLLSALVWLGWNKALDAAEHPDPVVQAREQQDLDRWLRHARSTLDAGLL